MTGWSFHSVKGGVGKSTLSTWCALTLARDNPETPVYLLDLDLTGTSLADGLPLQAPDFGIAEDTPFNWFINPTGLLSCVESQKRMIQREQRWRANPKEAIACGVPFINDWLLHADASWEPDKEISLETMIWRLENGPPNLKVLPSSALPGDLRRTIPVVFDEEYSAFIEGRLEYLLSAMAQTSEDAHVVVDVPPTIPGLSRAVLGVALRLSAVPQIPLALDGFIPDHLEAMKWHAGLVTTLDRPDIRAMNRWLSRIQPAERGCIKVVVNRVEPSRLSPEFRRTLLSDIFGTTSNTSDPSSFEPETFTQDTELLYEPAVESGVWVPDSRRLQVFGGHFDSEGDKIIRPILAEFAR